jgi:hypothetical protein
MNKAFVKSFKAEFGGRNPNGRAKCFVRPAIQEV